MNYLVWVIPVHRLGIVIRTCVTWLWLRTVGLILGREVVRFGYGAIVKV